MTSNRPAPRRLAPWLLPAGRPNVRVGLAAFATFTIFMGACGDDPAPQPQDKPAANADEAASAKYGLTPEQAAKPLATIGDVKITVGSFAERLGSQSPYLRARYASPERRREFLDNMIRFELLALEAEKEGFAKADSVQRVRKQMMVQRMMSELFEEQGVKLADIDEAEIKAYYEAHRDDFHKPGQVRASHILFKKKAPAEKVLASLKAGNGDMQQFRELAKAHNTDAETKDRLGDLRFFGETPSSDPVETPMPAELRAAAFTLEKAGALYPELIQSEAGFHILKLTGKRAKLERSLEDARRLIQNRLWRTKREEAIEAFVEDLRKRAEVKEDLSLLAQVQVPEPPADGEHADADVDGKANAKPADAKPADAKPADAKPADAKPAAPEAPAPKPAAPAAAAGGAE